MSALPEKPPYNPGMTLPPPTPLPTTFPGRIWMFLKILWQRLMVEQALDESAALAYHTLFSLLPVLVLIVLMLSIFSTHRRGEPATGLEGQVRTFLYQQFNLEALTIKDETGHPIDVTAELDKRIEHARTVIRHPLTGLIGFAVLVYGATKILLVIEKSFNRIYGGTSPRTWSRRITLYWTVLTLGPLLAAVSLAITNAFFAYAANSSLGRPLLAPMFYVASFLISLVLMVLLYKIIPGTHVNWTSALLGGAVSALIFEIGKNVFGLYVRFTVGGNNWYGTLALIPLFMFWIYLMWTFTLMGLHIAYIHQFYPRLARQLTLKQHTRSVLADPHCVLALAVVLVRLFRQGKASPAHELSDATDIPADVITDLLGGLERAKIVHKIDRGGYVLARPPELISAFDLISAARSMCLPTGHGRSDDPAKTPTLLDLDAHQSAWYRSHTLADLARETNA
jgi:membrane protein